MTLYRIFVLVIGLSASVHANPRVAVLRTHAYLSSERVAVMISQTGHRYRRHF